MTGTPGREGSERERGIQSSRPLHNFTLPNHLKWGHQKQLRCIKSSSSVRHRSQIPSNSASPAPPPPPPPSSDHRHHHRSNSSPHLTSSKPRNKDKSPIANSGDATEIEAVRERLISDLKVEADQLKLPILEEARNKNNNNVNNADEKKPSEEELPWNLRTRRATGKGINEGSRRQGQGLKGLAAVAAADKGEAGGSGEQSTPPRPKFSLTLTKEEIEADFLLMTGAKPPRRPKRRPKSVQKQLNALVPGGWLTEVTPESYRVFDTPDAKGEK